MMATGTLHEFLSHSHYRYNSKLIEMTFRKSQFAAADGGAAESHPKCDALIANLANSKHGRDDQCDQMDRLRLKKF